MTGYRLISFLCRKNKFEEQNFPFSRWGRSYHLWTAGIIIGLFCSNCRTPELAVKSDEGDGFIGLSVDRIANQNYDFCAGMLDGTAYDRFPQYSISTYTKASSKCEELYVLLEKSNSRKSDGSLDARVIDVLYVHKKYGSKSLLTECWSNSPANRKAYVIFPDKIQWENSQNLERFQISEAIGVDRSTEKLRVFRDTSLKCLNEDFGAEY